MVSKREPTLQRSSPDGLLQDDMRAEGFVPTGMFKTNKAVRVNFAGGFLGLMFGSSRGKVDAALRKQNADGWNLAEVIPDNPNVAIWLVRLVLLILTLGLWTISSGYIFIFEKPR